jgi:hypothetical protein
MQRRADIAMCGDDNGDRIEAVQQLGQVDRGGLARLAA